MKRLDVPSSRRRQIRRPKRVFISYSHDSEDHKSWVLSLAERLRDDGIDAWLDRYVVAPSEGWPRWILLQMEQADFTLLVCTATYCKRFDGRETVGQGLGASWEGLIANQILYDDSSRNRRFIPVLPPGGEPADIPRQLRASTYYELDVQYSDLCRYLLGTPELRPRPIRRAKPHTIRVKSAGLPAPSPLDAAHVGGFRRANSVSMSLLSPLNCDVFHCAVVATRYGPESGVWTTRVVNDHVLFGPDGNVSGQRSFLVLVESATREPLSLVADTPLWIEEPVPSGTTVRANERIATLRIPMNNVTHPPFRLFRGPTYHGLLKYRPDLGGPAWPSDISITSSRTDPSSGVISIPAPVAGVFEPAIGLEYARRVQITAGQILGYLRRDSVLHEVRAPWTGFMMSILVSHAEVYEGQPLLSLRVAKPTLILTMRPRPAREAFWYEVLSPIAGRFSLKRRFESGAERLIGPGFEFTAAAPICIVDGGDVSIELVLDVAGMIMETQIRDGSDVRLGQVLMVVRADTLLIRSPLSGNFFRAKSPGAEPMVKVGQGVREGDVVCIVEQLKIENEVTAGAPGVVERIFVDDGSHVEYGQPLFLIERGRNRPR